MNKTIPNICNLEPRYFQALLNALIKKNFYDDTEITYEYIINELYSDINDLVDINNELLSIEKILLKAAENNWDSKIFLDDLKLYSLSVDQLNVAKTVWNKESIKIHNMLLRKTRWTNSLEKMSWRVDMKTFDKNNSKLNDEPIITSYIELLLRNNLSNQNNIDDNSKNIDIVKFEMNREEVDEMLKQFNEIQKVFDKEDM